MDFTNGRDMKRNGTTSAKLPAALTQLAIQLFATLGIRLEAPTRFRTRVAEVSAPNWR